MDSMNRILVGGNELKSLGLKVVLKISKQEFTAPDSNRRLRRSRPLKCRGRRLIYFVNFSSPTPGSFKVGNV